MPSIPDRAGPVGVMAEGLTAAGLRATDAARLARIVHSLRVGRPDQEVWCKLTRQVLTPEMPFAVHRLLFDTVFGDRSSSDPPPAAWVPDSQTIAGANVTQLAKSLGLSDYDQLWEWANENRGAFWNAVCKSLGIRFQTPPQEILSMARGFEEAVWLVGARLNIIESCFQAPPNQVAIVAAEEGGALHRTTYGELESLARRVANGIRQAGYARGDRMGMMLPMTPKAVATYLGVILAGCVPVSIAESFAPREIEVRLRLAEAKAIFLSDVILRGGKTFPCYEKLAEVEYDVNVIVIPAGQDCRIPLGDRSWTWDTFISSQERFTAVTSPPDAETNILFSSGTTGIPKAIPWSQTTPIKCAADARFHHDVHSHSILAWPTSLGWMMGPWLIYATLLNRASMALYNGDPASAEFCKFVEDAKVTMLGVVPSLVRAWRQRQSVQGADWKHIEVFSSTGECSNAEDMLYLMSRAGYRPIIEYCGGTEIGGGYITGTVVQPCIPSAFSTPALGLDFQILDDDLPSEKGEVYLVPPSIGLSQRLLHADHHTHYYGETPTLPSRLPLRRHGDEIERIPGGYYRACGRTDDTMNLGGIKVSAVELERCLNRLPGIQETAAIAISDQRGGPSELVVYAVLDHADAEVSETVLCETMQDAIKRELNPLFRVRRVFPIDRMPRTASNKVLRRTLRDLYAKQHA